MRVWKTAYLVCKASPAISLDEKGTSKDKKDTLWDQKDTVWDEKGTYKLTPPYPKGLFWAF